MKVILAQAPAKNIKFNIGGYFKILPLGLAYIARKLKDNNIDFSIFFPRESKDVFLKFRNYLGSQRTTPNIIGISATLFSAREALKLAKIAKAVNAKNIVVIGGPITCFSAKSIFKYSQDLDYIVTGSGEQAFFLLARDLMNNMPVECMSNISYQNNSKVFSSIEEYQQDLDSLGFPLREAFPRWSHNLHPPMGSYSPAYLIETMRGCSYKCNFCAVQNSLRMRSIEMVVDEMKMLQKDFGAREVYFIDPTFSIDKERTRKLCQHLIDNNIKMRWTCMTRVDCVDRDLLNIMKAAGCSLIHFGVESATPKILEAMNKRQSVENTIEAFDGCRKVGIRTGAFVILASTIYDSQGALGEVIRLIRRIRPTYVLYDHVKPIPNGALVAEAIRNNIVTEIDLEEFYLGDQKKSRLSEITISGIPRALAQRWVDKASKSFYLSAGAMINILFGLRTKNDWLNLCKGGIYYYRDMLKKNSW